MNVSAELSLYPLDANYKERIISFIKRLKENKDLRIVTNGMSTQIFGDYDVLLDLLKEELKPELEKHRCMAVIKIGDGLMFPESIPSELK